MHCNNEGKKKKKKMQNRNNNNDCIKVQSEGLSLLFDYSVFTHEIQYQLHCYRLFAHLLDNYHLYDINIRS